MPPRREFDTVVEEALHVATDRVERIPGAGWRVAMVNGRPIDVRARAGDEWLELEAYAEPLVALQDEPDLWLLLRLNARLRGSARVASGPDGRLHVRAELFVGAGDDGAGADCSARDERVRILCHDVLTACHDVSAFRARQTDDAPEPDIPASDHDRLAVLCDEAGWKGGRDQSGAVSVPLDAAGRSVRALLTLSYDSRLRAVAPLPTGPLTSATSRAATALLLLRLSSTVRAVKGAMARVGNQRLPAVASACEPLRSPAALDRALSALAVASGFAGRELQAFEDAAVARHYLALLQPRRAHTHERPAGESTVYHMEDSTCLQRP